eukprot:TRINITY_DN16733_c0_g1_i1.p1 TRINITY_DN16733_c0_g1~~TRINITY_DN16733_c0_g1_i1.p1  ORF type:complete len:370 (+),score=61.24 TRINITY_DN16733_c0_g1_i1:130-1239(+)
MCIRDRVSTQSTGSRPKRLLQAARRSYGQAEAAVLCHFRMQPSINAFYVEFDNKLGPTVCAEYPHEGILRQDTNLFDSLSEYLIPKSDCCNKLLTVTAFGVTVIGYPIQLQDDDRYERNHLLFNVGFIISDDMVPTPYEPLVRKLAHYLQALEIESSFLSRDPGTTKADVEKILGAVVEGLDKEGCVHLPVDDANIIHLNLSLKLPDPPSVYPFQVPIRVRGFDTSDFGEWDLTLQQIIPHINGRSYIKQIAERADVHLQQVIMGIKHLLYIGFIKLIDIFQYSNMYMVTPEFTQLAENRDMQEECVRYVTLPGHTPPPITEIFQLYSQLKPGVRFGDFCGRYNTDAVGVDNWSGAASCACVTDLCVAG